MSVELIVPGTSSEIEDLLLTAFRAAVSKGDARGAASLSKELRKREKAENKKAARSLPVKTPISAGGIR